MRLRASLGDISDIPEDNWLLSKLWVVISCWRRVARRRWRQKGNEQTGLERFHMVPLGPATCILGRSHSPPFLTFYPHLLLSDIFSNFYLFQNGKTREFMVDV